MYQQIALIEINITNKTKNLFAVNKQPVYMFLDYDGQQCDPFSFFIICKGKESQDGGHKPQLLKRKENRSKLDPRSFR